MNNPQQSETIRDSLTEVASKRARKENPTVNGASLVNVASSTLKQIESVCGTALRQQIIDEKSGMNRRPFLATLAEFRKPDVEKFLGGLKITDKEWNLVRIHARFPGPFKAVTRAETFRCRIPQELLHSLLTFFDDSENTQRLAFGQAVRSIMNNGQVVLLDNVQLVQSVRSTAVKFILALADEVDSLSSSDADEIPSAERCTSVEDDTFRRCGKGINHSGRCSFTSKGSISVTAASDLVRSLSDQEIKSLSGLDDTKTVQGRDNFIRMRKLVDDLVDEDEQKKNFADRVDQSESFLKCNFMGHLSRVGNCCCNCLTCGFNDPKNPSDIVCQHQDDHRPSCIDCAKPFAILEQLQSLLEEKQQSKPESECTTTELELYSECAHEIERAYTNLKEYRSHLARHKAEQDFASEELDNLQDDEAAVTSDYKMKILAAFFRMNQQKWFGQRGITGLGFMIAYNNPEEPSKKIVKFLLLLTDDTLQDAEQVACAKQYVYSNELPPWVNRVRFRSDGAGCYKSQIHRVLQPYWTSWTGITEVSLSTDPRGGGKSALDGTFGRFGSVLSTAVNSGVDLVCKDDILDMYDKRNGVTGLKLLGFDPDRTKLLDCNLSITTESILRSELDPSTGQLLMYKHSSYGNGILVQIEDATFTRKNKEPVVFARDIVAEVDSYLTVEATESLVDVLPSFALCGVASLDRFMPQCRDVRETVNRKQELQGAGMSRPGEGASTAKQMQAKRAIRKNARRDAKACTIEDLREEKERRGVFCCPHRCPSTDRYCTAQFLSHERRDKHAESGEKCSFPVGVTAKDKLVQLASASGGVLELGSRPNRLVGAVSHDVVPSEEDAAGEKAACCFQSFNRKEGVVPYRKPAKLVEVLKELYSVRPKIDEKQMWQRMKAMRDADGSLMFCYGKRGTQPPVGMKKTSREWKEWAGCQVCNEKPCKCNGMLLTEEQIKAWIHQETARQKKNKK